MANFHIYHGPESTRRLATLADGELGSSSEEGQLYYGDTSRTPQGMPAAYPQVPLQGVSVRQLFNVGKQGLSPDPDLYTDAAGYQHNGAGLQLPARDLLRTGGVYEEPTYPVAMGYIRPYELADGGRITMHAIGAYTIGGPQPHLCARVKVGGSYIDPQWELDKQDGSTVGFDLVAGVPPGFDVSYPTQGLNALAGYEAANLLRQNTGAPTTDLQEQGRIQWTVDVDVFALGRHAKESRYDCDIPFWRSTTVYAIDDQVMGSNGVTYTSKTAHTAATTNEPGKGSAWTTDWTEGGSANVAIRCRWKVGLFTHNAHSGAGFSNTIVWPTSEYNPLMGDATLHSGTGTRRGGIYSWMGRQWLCHAASETTALTGAAHPLSVDSAALEQLLTEEAPGMGAHWREFWVPAVQEFEQWSYGEVDWAAGNEIELELGGATKFDITQPFPAYSATQAYSPENEALGSCSKGGLVYIAKAQVYSSTWPKMVAGASSATHTIAPDAALSGSISGPRYWRNVGVVTQNSRSFFQDIQEVFNVQGYVYGGRTGYSQMRVR